MISMRIDGKEYTVEYGIDDGTDLVHTDSEKREHRICVHTSGNLGYLIRSVQVSEAIKEWEVNHNTKLHPRN